MPPPLPVLLPCCLGPLSASAVGTGGLCPQGGDRASPPAGPGPFTLSAPPRARAWPTFLPHTALPCHPGGLEAGLQHPAGALPPRPPTLHPSPVLPVPGLRDFAETHADLGQSDLWAPGEAHPGRRKKMAEPSFPQSDSVNTSDVRGLAARLGPNLVTEGARTSRAAPSSLPQAGGLLPRARRIQGPDPCRPSTDFPLPPLGECSVADIPSSGWEERKALSSPPSGPGTLPLPLWREVPAGPGWPRRPAEFTQRPPCSAGRWSWGSRPGAQLLGRHAY